MVGAAPPLPSKRRRAPRLMGRYELIGTLARGGMGTVYLARHAGEAGFQRMFAVKVLHDHLAEDEAFIDMLRDEARIAARIHHPNVVAVVDLGTHGAQHYVVMDYVEGPSFATLWKRSAEDRPFDLILWIVIDALEGLHAAHTLRDDDGEHLNLVHRDVSPQNILVGRDGVARITDFGIAKAESRISSTMPGTRKGKIQFMSPEQIRDGENVDARSDIWAMGVVLWSMFANELLFKGENDGATVSNVLTKEIVPPSEMEGRSPPCLDEVVMKALDRDPEKRYETALEMADALRRVARENDLMGSRQRVAAWVEDTFQEELERRRTAIRDVVQRRSGAPEATDVSQLTVLPSLPSSTGQTDLSGEHTPGRASGFTASGRAAGGNTLVDTIPAPSIKNRTPIIVGAIAAGAVLAIGLLAALSSDGDSESGAAAATAAPEPVAPAETPSKSNPSATEIATADEEPVAQEHAAQEHADDQAEAASSKDGENDEGEESESSDREDKKAKRRATVRVRRVPPAPPAGAETPAGAAATKPPEPHETASPPLPKAAPRTEIETNPYLRH